MMKRFSHSFLHAGMVVLLAGITSLAGQTPKAPVGQRPKTPSTPSGSVGTTPGQYSPEAPKANQFFRWTNSAKVRPFADPMSRHPAYQLSPFDGSNDLLYMVRDSKLLTWKVKGQGFQFMQERALPSAPEPTEPGPMPPSGFFLSEDGGIFYAGKEKIYRFTEGKWDVYAPFPKALTHLPHWCAPTFLWGPDEKLLVLGSLESMIEFYQVQEGKMELVRSIGFESAGSHKSNFTEGGPAQACVIGDACWALFTGNGRYFRINLESGSVKELNMPWTQWFGGNQPNQGKWTGMSQGEVPPMPVMPCAVQFIPEPGSSSPMMLALMWNMEPAYFYEVTCNSDGGDVQTHGRLAQDLGDVPKFRDEQGTLQGLKALSKPHVMAVPITNSSTTAAVPAH